MMHDRTRWNYVLATDDCRPNHDWLLRNDNLLVGCGWWCSWTVARVVHWRWSEAGCQVTLALNDSLLALKNAGCWRAIVEDVAQRILSDAARYLHTQQQTKSALRGQGIRKKKDMERITSKKGKRELQTVYLEEIDTGRMWCPFLLLDATRKDITRSHGAIVATQTSQIRAAHLVVGRCLRRCLLLTETVLAWSSDTAISLIAKVRSGTTVQALPQHNTQNKKQLLRLAQNQISATMTSDGAEPKVQVKALFLLTVRTRWLHVNTHFAVRYS